MQFRVNDVTVNKSPKFLAHDPTDHTHALTLKDPHNPAQTVILPLALRGVTLLLNVRAPTLDEWNSDAFTWLTLTSETLNWDPTMTQYSDQEAAMTDYPGSVVGCAAVRGHVGILAIHLLSSLTTDLADVKDDEHFYQVLTSKVMISSVKTSLNGHIRLRKKAPIDPQTLAAWWMISPDRAKRTVVMTTSRPMTGCCGTNDSSTPCSLTLCLPQTFPVRVTKWHRFTPHPLDEPVPTQ